MAADINTQIDKNFEFFTGLFPSIAEAHHGEFALLRDSTCTGIYQSLVDAVAVASNLYKDGLYSIQEVTDAPVDLGFFSHADNSGDVCC